MSIDFAAGRKFSMLLFIILAVAASLRLYGLTAFSLSNDELSALARLHFNGISEAIQAIRKLMDSIRNSLSSVSSEIMGRSLNIMIPLQKIVIKIKDLLSKSQGVMTTSIFTLLGAYDTLRSVIGSIVGIIVAILISIGILIYTLFLIPFGFGIPFAIPMLVMFILIAVPGIMVYIIQVMILKKMVSPIPGL